MTDGERESTIRPAVVEKAVNEYYQPGKTAHVGSLNPTEFDEWLKHTVIQYRYPLLVTAVLSAGWLAYRFVSKFLKQKGV